MARFHHALFASTPRIWVTRAIVVINVVVFVLMVANGVSPMKPDTAVVIQWGANFGPKTMSGEWWRLVSSMFLHFGIIHIGFNMWVLWDVGRLVERLVGNVGFIILYVFAGITGSIASLAWHPVVVSAGASGAVFGVFGALLGFLVLRRDTVPADVLRRLRNVAVSFLILNILFGLSISGIDNAAHLGGFAGGFLCGLVLSQPLDGQTRSRRWRRNLVTSVMALVLVPSAVIALPEAPVDLGAELARSGKAEVAILEQHQAIVAQWANDEIDDAEAASRIETVVADWSKLRAKIEELAKRAGAKRELLLQLAHSMRLREESWRIQIDAIRESDRAKFTLAHEKAMEADQALESILPATN